VHARLERDAGPGRGLLEEQRDGAALEGARRERLALERVRPVEQAAKVGGRKLRAGE